MASDIGRIVEWQATLCSALKGMEAELELRCQPLPGHFDGIDDRIGEDGLGGKVAELIDEVRDRRNTGKNAFVCEQILFAVSIARRQPSSQIRRDLASLLQDESLALEGTVPAPIPPASAESVASRFDWRVPGGGIALAFGGDLFDAGPSFADVGREETIRNRADGGGVGHR